MTIESNFPSVTVKKGLFGKTETSYFQAAPAAPVIPRKKERIFTSGEKKKGSPSKFQRQIGAVAAGAALVSTAYFTGHDKAASDHCTSPTGQQVQVEDGIRGKVQGFFEKLGIGEHGQTVSGLARQLEQNRGYSISEAQLVSANKKSGILQYDSDGKLKEDITPGTQCAAVPSPVYSGFERVDDHESIHQIATANLLSVTALKTLNPSFINDNADKPLPDGVILKVDQNPTNSFVYRDVTPNEHDINTMSGGNEKKRLRMLRLNASILGSGKSVSEGSVAWLPANETAWMKDNHMDLADIRDAFPTTEATTEKTTKGDKRSPETKQKESIAVPEYGGFSHEVSVKATDKLAERGEAWKHRAEAMRYFMDQSFTDFQAAGIIGNCVIESADVSLPSGQKQFHGGPGIGIVQWEGGRKVRLIEFANARHKSWTDFDTQRDFIMEEFKTSERGAYKWLIQTKDVTGATDVVLNKFERPKHRILEPRLDAAKVILKEYRDVAHSIANAE